MNEYLSVFIDKDYPHFLDKYLNTKTMDRIKYVTQFCGCDYTKLYSTKFLYTRFDHSLVVAHMVWHFSHSKSETIAALLHDAGTPCFAHCIDYVFGDYINQESSERKISDIIKNDQELLSYLKEDGIAIEDLENLSKYPILENKSPKLCADRLDGVFHTCYIWLHTHKLQEIKEVYDGMTVLINEDNNPEIGFIDQKIANKFVEMVFIYAKELQGNTDKYIMKYVSEIVKLAFERNLITLDDLYTMKESDLCSCFKENFPSWSIFENANTLTNTDNLPENNFHISFTTKKRNTIPLVKTKDSVARINTVSEYANKIYQEYERFIAPKYAYVKELKKLN